MPVKRFLNLDEKNDNQNTKITRFHSIEENKTIKDSREN